VQHQIVCSGEAAGGYAAFPDICRLKTGDLYCVFYSGYGHVSTPNDKWPKGGRIMAVRSTDNGKTWREPFHLKLDSPYSFACSAPVRQLPDGSMILGLYCEDDKAKRTFGATVKSYDGGKTWNGPVKIDTLGGAYPSMVELPDGLAYCVYYEEGKGSSIRAVRLRVDTMGVTVVDKKH
jgi:hypothetical protein